MEYILEEFSDLESFLDFFQEVEPYSTIIIYRHLSRRFFLRSLERAKSGDTEAMIVWSIKASECEELADGIEHDILF